MKHNLIYIISLLLFVLNCASNNQIQRKNYQKKIGYKAIPKINKEGEFGVNVLLNLPNSLFVFQKTKNNFEAVYQISISVLDSTEKQIEYYSWKEKKNVEYFDETRAEAESISTEHFFKLVPNKYMFSILIEDMVSKYRWQKKLKLKDYSEEFLSVLLIPDSHEKEKLSGEYISEKTETIQLKISHNFLSYNKDSLLYIKVLNKNEVVLIDSIEVKTTPDIFNHDIKISEYWVDELDINLNYKNISENLKLNLLKNNSLYWKDINNTIQIMTYILSSSDIQKLKDFSKSEKVEYIKNYWKLMDPTPDTQKNEVMDEFFSRVDYVSLNFSEIGPGWQSDRGRTYILYGPPEHIEITNQNNQGYIFETWHYKSGKQFIFIDEGMFGNYRLYREIN